MSERINNFEPRQRKDGRWSLYIPGHLNPRNPGKRTAKTFPKEQKAEAFAFAESLRRRELQMNSPECFDERDGMWLAMTRDRLKKYGKTLTDMLDHYLAYLETRETLLSLQEAKSRVDEYYKRLAAINQCSRNHENWMKRIGEVLCDGLGEETLVSDLTPDQLEQFWLDHCGTPESYSSWRPKASAWFGLLAKKQWIKKGNPMLGTRKFKAAMDQDAIIHVEELETLIAYYLTKRSNRFWESDFRQLLLGCFAGLRKGETKSLRWEHIDLDERAILITTENSKTQRAGFVPINDTMAEWIATWKQPEDPAAFVCPKEPYERKARLREDTKVEIPKNAFRRSFASHHYALHVDPKELGRAMRHEITTTSMRWYRRLVKSSEGKAWFDLTPDVFGVTTQLPKPEERPTKSKIVRIAR